MFENFDEFEIWMRSMLVILALAANTHARRLTISLFAIGTLRNQCSIFLYYSIYCIKYNKHEQYFPNTLISHANLNFRACVIILFLK